MDTSISSQILRVWGTINDPLYNPRSHCFYPSEDPKATALGSSQGDPHRQQEQQGQLQQFLRLDAFHRLDPLPTTVHRWASWTEVLLALGSRQRP